MDRVCPSTKITRPINSNMYYSNCKLVESLMREVDGRGVEPRKHERLPRRMYAL